MGSDGHENGRKLGLGEDHQRHEYGFLDYLGYLPLRFAFCIFSSFRFGPVAWSVVLTGDDLFVVRCMYFFLLFLFFFLLSSFFTILFFFWSTEWRMGNRTQGDQLPKRDGRTWRQRAWIGAQFRIPTYQKGHWPVGMVLRCIYIYDGVCV